jgi:hypothetical protein
LNLKFAFASLEYEQVLLTAFWYSKHTDA